MAAKKKEYEVDRVLAEWLIVALILFALLVEVILHKLEHWIMEKHAHLQAVLRILYRELMILGMVSFGFILFIFIASPSGDLKLTFEVAHVFIFLFACFHTFVVMCTVFMSLRLSQRWKTMERMELVKYLEKKEKYRKIVDRLERKRGPVWRYWSWWFPKFGRVLKYWKLHEIMAFHDIRFQFIYYRNLPKDFKFSSFLRKVKTNSFIELVEIHPTHFLFLLAVTLLDIARVESKADFGVFFEPAFLIAESVLNIILVTVLGLKIRRIYWKLTRNPATYYDQVDRRSLEEEHYIAQEVKKIAAESVPQSRRMSRTFDRKSQDGVSSPTITPGTGVVSPGAIMYDARDDEDAVMRKSVDMDRPRMSTDRRSRRTSHSGAAHGAGSSAGHAHGHGHKPIYQNMAYVPPKSIPSSGTHTPSEHGEPNIDLGDVVARHSLDINREDAGSLDTSRIGTDPSLTTDRPSARSSFDKPRKYDPSQTLTNQDGTIALDAVAKAAQRRRSETNGRTSLEVAGRFSRTKDAPDSGRRHSNASRPRLSVDRDRRISRDHRDSTASRRTSVDLSQTLPVPELAARNANTRPLKMKKNRASLDDQLTVDLSDDGMGMDAKELRELAKKRIAEKSKPTPALVNHAKMNEAAKTANVADQYPRWLVKCLPRLGRVASPAERLFWFGSPKFYLWCVEWVLFFSTINLSATLAMVGTVAKKRDSLKAATTAKASARFLVTSIHQTTKNATSATSNKRPGIRTEGFVLLMIALLIAFITLGYVLFRIAGIMKKYIFVLNNANMIPETLTIEAIQRLRVKDLMKNDYEAVYADGSDTEVDEGEYAQARANMSTFFTNEVQGGRMPGTAAAEQKRRVSVSSRRTSNGGPGDMAVAGTASPVDNTDVVEAVAEASNV